MPWAATASGTPRCRRTDARGQGHAPRPWCCTAPTTSAARSARPSSGTPRCASAASRPGWSSTRAAPHVHPRRARRHTDRLQPRVVDWVEQYAGDAAAAPPRIDAAHWQRRLADARQAARGARRAARHPARRPGRRRRARRGRARRRSTRTPASPATTDSVFQIGSITKVWTATVVMRLVDEGQLDLDTPVVEVLPELRLADPDVTKRRHDPAPAHPHQRHRRRRLHRHRPRRRLPGEVRRPARRRRAEPPARRDLVLLQLRLLAARPDHREGHRQDLGRRRCASGSSRRSA